MKKSLIASSKWLMAVCFASIFLLIFNYLPLAISHQPLALALDSSPSADIKSKLKALQEDIASRAANMKAEVTKKLQNKAYIGTVKDKNSTFLTLSTTTDIRNVNINQFTEYIIKSKTYIGDGGLKNITPDNTIAALGDIDDKGVLIAKRIVKLTSPPPKPKKIIHGIVISLSDGNLTLRNIQNEQFSIIFDKKTDYQKGKSDANFSDIKTNSWIIIVTDRASETLLAKYVYIFPSALNIKPKFSTPSATMPKK